MNLTLLIQFFHLDISISLGQIRVVVDHEDAGGNGLCIAALDFDTGRSIGPPHSRGAIGP